MHNIYIHDCKVMSSASLFSMNYICFVVIEHTSLTILALPGQWTRFGYTLYVNKYITTDSVAFDWLTKQFCLRLCYH